MIPRALSRFFALRASLLHRPHFPGAAANWISAMV